MPTNVDILPEFRQRVRRLGKKYPSITHEVRQLVAALQSDERPGDRLRGIGYTVYKARLPNRAARRGKSGGFRVVYFVQLADSVTLLTIYSKTDQSDISVREIQQLVAEALD